MRTKLSFLLLAVLTTACRSQIVCCELDGGGHVATTAGECADNDLDRVPDSLCEDITDVDLDLNDNDSDTDDTQDDPLTDAERCDAYCDALLEACPSDTLCLESCGHSTTPPDDAAITCAEDATTCQETNVCWGLPWFDVPPQ